jgi:hypothetical protein
VCVRPWLEARREAEPPMLTLQIGAPGDDALPLFKAETSAPALVLSLPDPLCYGCVYAHIIRGSASNQELIACGYVFPARETPFRVRECTDYRPKRERNRVEIAREGAVCILSLDETATDFQAIAAARNGEGES